MVIKIQIMLIYYSCRKKSHLISVSDSHSCECLIWPSYTEAWNAKLHKKDKVEEIVDVIKRRKQTNKPGIDFFLSSNLCLSSLRRKIMPPSQLSEAQRIRQLSSRCFSLSVSNSNLTQLRMGSGRLTLCWCLR